MQQPPNQDYPQQQWQQHTSWGSTPQWQQHEPPPQYQQQTFYPQQLQRETPPPPPLQWNPQLPPQQYPQNQWYQQPPKETKLPWYKKLIAWCRRHPIASALIIGGFLAVCVIGSLSSSPSTTNENQTSSATQTTSQGQPTQNIATQAPTTVPTPTPTIAPTPTPTESPSQLEATYKASTADTTIATLDKDGNADQGKDVHFTCTILNFVKDSNGNTAGANVDDPNTSGVVQIIFPTNTDLSQLNTEDTLEVWGTNEGSQSGQNAFGATIQEVVVSANYMTDQTTNYQANG